MHLLLLSFPCPNSDPAFSRSCLPAGVCMGNIFFISRPIYLLT